MTINQLKYVIAISKASSMREAANKLYISQPALTASVAELEEELGLVLFERSNKGVTLTKDGREFVVYAKKAINQYEILEDKYLSAKRKKEYFSVSSQHYNFAVDAFAELINEFNPDKYIFSFHETKTSEVLANVRDMKSEVGIIAYSEDTKKVLEKILKNYQLRFVPLMYRETYAYVWENHELAERETISLEELKEYPCVSFEQSHEEDYYMHEEALANVDFDKMIKSDDRATSMEIIEKTQGYAIGSGMLSDDKAILKGLVSIKLEEEDTLTIGYIYRKNMRMSAYGKAYIEKLEKYREIEI